MTRRDPVDRRAPVVSLRPSVAGGPSARRPAIVSVTDVGGRRVSTVRRGDGSAFTVTVPAGGIDVLSDPVHHGPWIRQHGEDRSVPLEALRGLAAHVGLRLAPDEPPGHPGA